MVVPHSFSPFEVLERRRHLVSSPLVPSPLDISSLSFSGPSARSQSEISPLSSSFIPQNASEALQKVDCVVINILLRAVSEIQSNDEMPFSERSIAEKDLLARIEYLQKRAMNTTSSRAQTPVFSVPPSLDVVNNPNACMIRESEERNFIERRRDRSLSDLHRNLADFEDLYKKESIDRQDITNLSLLTLTGAKQTFDFAMIGVRQAAFLRNLDKTPEKKTFSKV